MAYQVQPHTFIRFGQPQADGRSGVGLGGTRKHGGTSAYSCEFDSSSGIYRIIGKKRAIDSASDSVSIHRSDEPILLIHCEKLEPPEPKHDDDCPLLTPGAFQEICQLELVSKIELTFKKVSDS